MTTDRGVEPMSPDERCDEIIRLIDEALRDQPPPRPSLDLGARRAAVPGGRTRRRPRTRRDEEKPSKAAPRSLGTASEPCLVSGSW